MTLLVASALAVAVPKLSGLPSWQLLCSSVARLGTFLDLAALGASLGALAQLALVCLAVRALRACGRLPNHTPQVLSSLSFSLLLPCFLASRVAAALASAPQGSGLRLLPLFALAQVALGAALGLLLWSLTDGSLRAALAEAWRRRTQPWDGARRPSQGAAAVAASVALAVRAPLLAYALAPAPTRARAPGGAYGPHAWRMVVAGCAFGNSVTLPLLLLAAVLSPADAQRATGIAALFMAGWSPLLWSAGWRILAPLGTDEASPADGQADVPPRASTPPRPPLRMPAARAPPLSLDAARFAAQRAARALSDAGHLALSLAGRVLNPPLLGVLLGLFIGLTPLKVFVTSANTAAAALTQSLPPPFELAIFAAAMHSALTAMNLLGNAALPVGTLVLASSLVAGSAGGASSESRPLLASDDVTSSDVAHALMRGGRAAEGVTALVRLLLLPAVTLWLGWRLDVAGLLPVDPLLRLLLCLQSCMPSAQNLVLLLTLRRGTVRAAQPMAQTLVRQYTLAALPCAAWMAAFSHILL